MTDYSSYLLLAETHDTEVSASVTHNDRLGGNLLLTLEYKVSDLDIKQKFEYTLTKNQIRDLAAFLIEESE